MLDCDIVHIGAGHFWIVLSEDKVDSSLRNWCNERGVVLEQRTYWYDHRVCALIHADEAAEFRSLFLGQ